MIYIAAMSKKIVTLLLVVLLVNCNARDAEKRLVLHDDESVITTIHRFEAELATLNATLRKQISGLSHLYITQFNFKNRIIHDMCLEHFGCFSFQHHVT